MVRELFGVIEEGEGNVNKAKPLGRALFYYLLCRKLKGKLTASRKDIATDLNMDSKNLRQIIKECDELGMIQRYVILDKETLILEKLEKKAG